MTEEEIVGAIDMGYRLDGALAKRLISTTAHTHALVELLVAKGILTVDEVQEALNAIGPQVGDEMTKDGAYVLINTAYPDKYDMELVETGARIDCENRIHLCQGACCRMWFALSEQDISEGVMQWDLRRPYAARKAADGWCIHQDRETRGCHIYDQRPSVCRQYQCRDDKRIWEDFEGYVPNPNLLRDSNNEAWGRSGMGGGSDVAVAPPVRRRITPVAEPDRNDPQ